ncbi:hypothetical protein Gotri_007537 [Gossypium trilobum]|uniref:Uncharacterized protein n=1 Tax=Gossypium trilobum TaxID=34281 RepID=A0A7J9EGW7_9ROSI|nr:hypothetical protein [Gossypium trilobum]
MGHGVKDCKEILAKDKNNIVDEFSYSITLRAESSLIGKECLHFGSSLKQTLQQCNYSGRKDLVPHSLSKIIEDTLRWELSKELIKDDMQEEWDKMQSTLGTINLDAEFCHNTKTANWKHATRLKKERKVSRWTKWHGKAKCVNN